MFFFCVFVKARRWQAGKPLAKRPKISVFFVCLVPVYNFENLLTILFFASQKDAFFFSSEWEAIWKTRKKTIIRDLLFCFALPYFFLSLTKYRFTKDRIFWIKKRSWFSFVEKKKMKQSNKGIENNFLLSVKENVIL